MPVGTWRYFIMDSPVIVARKELTELGILEDSGERRPGKNDGLMALARQLDSRSAEAFGTQLAEAVREFRGGTAPQDDETIIVMQRVSTT